MNLDKIKELIDTIGFPVAYDHFHNKVNPPFITYRELPLETFNADDCNYINFKDYEIELCTLIKDIKAENKLEVLFFENKIPFEKNEEWDDTEKVYHIIYTI